MPQVVRVASISELPRPGKIRKPSQRQLVKEEYRSFVGQVEAGRFLELKLSEDELRHYPTVKDRLLSAAKDLGKAIMIRRRSDLVRVTLANQVEAIPPPGEDVAMSGVAEEATDILAEDQTEDEGLDVEEEIDEEPIMRPPAAQPQRGRPRRQ